MLPFPVSSELCTYFATETQIRCCGKYERPGYEITVQTQSSDRPAVLEEFPLSYSSGDQSEVNRHLKEDIEKAFGLMKQKAEDEDDGEEQLYSRRSHRSTKQQKPRLLDDTMTISVATREQAHISIVDIPGLVKSKIVASRDCEIPNILNCTDGTKKDIELSEALAKRYISNPRAITL